MYESLWGLEAQRFIHHVIYLVIPTWSGHNMHNRIQNFKTDIFSFFVTIQPQDNVVTTSSLK